MLHIVHAHTCSFWGSGDPRLSLSLLLALPIKHDVELIICFRSTENDTLSLPGVSETTAGVESTFLPLPLDSS